MSAIQINQFNFQYSPTTKAVFKDLNVTFQDNQFSLLIGPSGSGKTTLLKFIAGLYPQFLDHSAVYQGQVLINDQDINQLTPQNKSQSVAMMFQNPDNQFAMDTVYNELIFTLENMQVEPAQIPTIIEKTLQFCQITHLKDRQLATLSGGEKQRVALSCIVAMDADVIVLDEPFASIDPQSRLALINQLHLLQTQYHKTIILADHDLSTYQEIVDAVFEVTADANIVKLDKATAANRFANFKLAKLANYHFDLPDNHATLIKLDQFQINNDQRALLNTTSFNFYQGKTTLITGENGIGKSTLFKALTKLIPYQGTVYYQDTNIQKFKPLPYAKQVSLLFQEADKQFLEVLVKEEIALSQAQSTRNPFTQGELTEIIADLKLTEHLEQSVYSLSEGQKKKLQILVMLIMNPPVLLLDEPLKGLDLESLNVVLDLLNLLKVKHQATQIIISHQFTNLDRLVDYHIKFKEQQLTYQEDLL